MSGIGDNSVNGGQLKSIIERIENVDLQIKDLQDDRKDILLEAKSNGFDVKTIKAVIALRKMDRQKRIEAQMLLDTYMSALGELAELPLGKAAIARDFGG